MSWEDYEDVIRPKVQGTSNIHRCLSAASLDFFIILSSCAGIVGNHGQGNYASACTFQDAFGRWRTGQGFPTRSLDLGVVEGAGYASENPDSIRFLRTQGYVPINVDELLALIIMH